MERKIQLIKRISSKDADPESEELKDFLQEAHYLFINVSYAKNKVEVTWQDYKQSDKEASVRTQTEILKYAKRLNALLIIINDDLGRIEIPTSFYEILIAHIDKQHPENTEIILFFLSEELQLIESFGHKLFLKNNKEQSFVIELNNEVSIFSLI